MRTAIMFVASLALCTVAWADGQGQGRGSFSSGRSMGQSSGQSAGRAHSAPRSSGNFRSYRSEGRAAPSRAVPGRTFSEGRNNFSGSRSYSNGRNFSGSRDLSGSRTFSGGRNVGAETPAFRANPRPGFQTTRPDFGTGAGNRVTRPGFSTRPDMNTGDRWNDARRNDGSSRSNSGNRNRDGRWDFDRRPGFDGRTGSNTNRGNFRSHPGFDHRGSRWHDGFGHSHRSRWHGGYWKGSFWPRVYYYPGFVSFWPYLPSTYRTFWYGGISYYYVNDLYYTWNPDRYGYVVTDPPPAAESPAPAESTDPGPGSVYVYPRQGQSEEQTATDRFECHQWAVSQTGFDPTTATADTQSAGGGSDYRRALIACLDARGYSAN